MNDNSRRVLIFDLNGTLLDLSALDGRFEYAFGAVGARELWFKELTTLVLTSVITGRYLDFPTQANAALAMLAENDRVELPAGSRTALLESLQALPAFPDVIPALTRLRDAGARLAILTNGTLQSAYTQLEFAGLSELFHQVLSADEVQHMKPAPEPYRMAAERFGCQPEELLMVAAHGWDLAGASAAGLRTAFLARPRQALSPSGPRPDFVASDLGALAELVLREPTLPEARHSA